MRRCPALPLLAGFLLLALLLASSAEAGDMFGRLGGRYVHHRRHGMVEPQQHVAAPPGPHRYPQYNAAAAPWYGYGFGVPTYNWGYFGAKYRPAVVSHHGYYGDFSQWGYRQGY